MKTLQQLVTEAIERGETSLKLLPGFYRIGDPISVPSPFTIYGAGSGTHIVAEPTEPDQPVRFAAPAPVVDGQMAQ